MNRLPFFLTATLLALLPFHAFLYTWLHSFFWTDGWMMGVQAWKEVVLLALAFLAAWQFIRKPSLPGGAAGWLAVTFLVWSGIYFAFGDGAWSAKLFGLRSLALVFIAFLSIQFFIFSAIQKTKFIQILLSAAAVVITFALLQKWVLPVDFLRGFGYSEVVSTWLPGGNLPMYHIVGGTEIIRTQATFAGPNQLAAWLLLVLPPALAAAQKWRGGWRAIAIFVATAGGVTLFLTYSRAAWLGAMLALGITTLTFWPRFSRRLKITAAFGAAFLVIAGGLLFATQPALQTAMLRQASSSEHLQKSLAAAQVMRHSPTGLGLGNTAGASQRADGVAESLTPENTFLTAALELGWLGGLLFIAALAALAVQLKTLQSPIFYSIVALIAVLFFLHPLEDAPTALTLGLLAGLAPFAETRTQN